MINFFKQHREIIAYLIVGFLTTAVSLIVYYALTTTLLDPQNGLELQIANIISWVISVLFAFITNRRYVFQSKEKALIKQMLLFFVGRLGTLLLDMLLMFLLVTRGGMNDRIAKVLVQILVIIGNYIFSKLIVFRKG